MGVLSGMVWNRLTELPHPVVQERRCINCFRRHNCTACADVCPEQVMQPGGKVESWSSCTDCQHCVTACPTRAIGPSEQRLQRLLTLRTGEEERLWLGCDRSGRENDLSVDCLCGMCWEELAYLSFFRRLVIDLAPCGGCEKTECRRLLGEQLCILRSFLGQERFSRRVVLVYEDEAEAKPRQELSRRDLFQQGAKLSKNGIESLLRQAPMMNPEELKLDGLSLRSLLHRQMERSGEVFYWTVPKVSGACNGCESCVKSCPTQALRLSGDGKWLVLDPGHCTNCGGCSIACTKRRITGTETVGLRSFAPVALAEIHKITCRICGREMRAATSNGMCGECLRRRMAEAAQRNRRERGE